MDATTAKQTLVGLNFAEVLGEALASYPGASQQHVDDAVGWVGDIRDTFVGVLENIDDPDEVSTTLAIHYIELKSRWIALNTKINYAMFRTGSVNPEDALRGTAVSTLLMVIEDFIADNDIDKITEFLAEPVKRAA